MPAIEADGGPVWIRLSGPKGTQSFLDAEKRGCRPERSEGPAFQKQVHPFAALEGRHCAQDDILPTLAS
jgi:hypothetical protein